MENHFFLNAGVHFDQPEIPTWHSLTAMDSDLQFPPPPLTDCFFDSSAISSMASSPVSNSNESFLIKELIGKLGNICNSGGETINRAIHPVPPAIPGDPKFIERAARFSSLGSQSFNGRNTHLPCTNAASSKLHRVCSSPSINASEVRNPRKRKSLPKGKCRDVPCSSPQKELNEKRSKLNPEINDRKTEHRLEEEEDDEEEDEDEIKKQSIKQKQSIDATKDYIHVRARRGQATDSHSLAERVRREKISERMKLLQDLVPGCNKVTGKALMLEEIINYVQSLQGQVEFLSMKLASVHPRLDFNHPQQNAFGAKNNYPSDYENQLQQNGMGLHCSNPMDPIINQSHDLHLPTLDGFNNGVHELCEGDLHSIVQMGFAQNTQSLHGSNQAAAMKTEF